jgi:hypothetical protein
MTREKAHRIGGPDLCAGGWHGYGADRSPAARDGGRQLQRLLSQETTMKKLIALAALAFVLAAGTVTVLTVHPQPAMADCSTC